MPSFIPIDQLANRVFSILASINYSCELRKLDKQLDEYLNYPTLKNRRRAQELVSEIVYESLAESGGYEFIPSLPTSVTIVYLYAGALLVNITFDPILCEPDIFVGTSETKSYPQEFINWVNTNTENINQVPLEQEAWITKANDVTTPFPNYTFLSYVTCKSQLVSFFSLN